MSCAAEICCYRFNFSWSDIVNRQENRHAKLLQAVASDHFKCVKRLIGEGADVNTVNPLGLTPLMISAERGHVRCLNVLIAAEAEIDRVEHNTLGFWSPNKPALIRAANRGQWKCVEALVNAGADVNIALENRFTPLMHATFGGHVKCVELLINAGADVNMTNRYGNASISQIPRFEYKTEIVEMLIKAGADVNAPDLYGRPQILSAARQGTWRFLKLIIDSGADVNATDAQYNTALIYAAERHETDESYCCLRVLLEAEAKINIVNSDHNNAFSQHYQQGSPDRDICLLLFAAGEMVNTEQIEEIKNSGDELAISRYFKDNLDLKHLCREAIRKHLLHLDPHTHLFGRVPSLGLPKPIVNYLAYDVSLQTEDKESFGNPA